jgi:RHS repeat-associated protein
MNEPGNERLAVAQTPYSAFPGAPGVLERIAGATTDTRTLDPFGDNAAAPTGATGSNLGFQGDWTDPTNAQVWMGARWYSPVNAGFASRDTHRGEARTPVSLNQYTYANANPIRGFDPTGHFCQDTLDGTTVCDNQPLAT